MDLIDEGWRRLARFRLAVALPGTVLAAGSVFAQMTARLDAYTFLVATLWVLPFAIYLVAFRSRIGTFLGGPVLLVVVLTELLMIFDSTSTGAALGFILYPPANLLAVVGALALDFVFVASRRPHGAPTESG
jgi:hypothetical protein